MTYYKELKTESKVRLALLNKARAATDWKDSNGIDRIELEVTDFADDPKVVELIERFDCKAQRKLSIFRFKPFTCHAWHTDLQRFAAINMLLDGHDSLTLFGERAKGVNLENVEKLYYWPNRYYVLNSKKQHTVVNFANTRYLVSIGIPQEFTFQTVLDYIDKEGA